MRPPPGHHDLVPGPTVLPQRHGDSLLPPIREGGFYMPSPLKGRE